MQLADQSCRQLYKLKSQLQRVNSWNETACHLVAVSLQGVLGWPHSPRSGCFSAQAAARRSKPVCITLTIDGVRGSGSALIDGTMLKLPVQALPAHLI